VLNELEAAMAPAKQVVSFYQDLSNEMTHLQKKQKDFVLSRELKKNELL
jgi:hypothetical protein